MKNQVTKINPETLFSFDNSSNVGYPLAPLVSAKKDTKTNILTVRIVVFIDANNTSIPSINPNVVEKDGTLSLTVDYNYIEETPKSYSSWYLEYSYLSENVMNINTVFTVLCNEDPVTSRGTTVNP